MIFLRNGLFLGFEKSLGHFVFAIFLILLIKNMRDTNSLFTHVFFSFFFKWRQFVDCDVLRLNPDSRVLLHWLHSTDSFKVYWSTSNNRPGLGSSLRWWIAITKLWKPLSNLLISNNTLAINTRKLLSCFWYVILKLPQHYISNMYFQFLHFRGWEIID